MSELMALEERFAAHNYAPLPVVLNRAEGVYAWDTEGRRYIDMMSAYSAVSFGHAHPRLVAALRDQAARLGVVSRAYYSDQLGAFLQRACELTGMDQALPMNTGAEAVETAVKAARKWGYEVKGVAEGEAEIITCAGNFHGRTITIVGFSSEAQYRQGFGPFPKGFITIPYGDVDALEAAITPRTAALLIEPIQGEGGIIVPPEGYLRACAELCRRHRVLLLADEVQTGLGRTGYRLACDHEGVRPDGVILGKALGGGLYPVSLFLAREELMAVFQPGDHGSTFGGNPIACAVGMAALELLEEQQLAAAAQRLGRYFRHALGHLQGPLIRGVRGRGLLIGVEIDTRLESARSVCERLLGQGILSKDTHETVIRFAPPLVITEAQIDEAMASIAAVLVGGEAHSA